MNRTPGYELRSLTPAPSRSHLGNTHRALLNCDTKRWVR